MSASLRSLSDKEMLSRTRALIVQERGITLLVLLHLNEIERRRLHFIQGYKSMFDYCTSGLGYSASAASRRIRTARCIARFPEVYALLTANEVNLSTVSLVSRLLTPGNGAEVLKRIRGKSQKEVLAIAAEYEPRAALPPDRVRPVVLLRKRADHVASTDEAGKQETVPALAMDLETHADKKYDRCGCNSATLAGTAERERWVTIQFSASEQFMTKVERVRSLAAHRLPGNASLEQVFELAMDFTLEKEDPAKRIARREARKAAAKHDQPRSENPRHIPAAVRDQVFMKDRQQCAYIGANGRRCASRHLLQIDHIKPVARGGASTLDNLRLLCAYHNRLEAERLMGLSSPRRAGPLARPHL